MNQLNLDRSQSSELRKVFEEMDENKDGTLTKEEVTKCMKVYLDAGDFDSFNYVLRNLDADGSNKIDYSEFLTLTSNI